jgi:hypothetical protein
VAERQHSQAQIVVAKHRHSQADELHVDSARLLFQFPWPSCWPLSSLTLKCQKQQL